MSNKFRYGTDSWRQQFPVKELKISELLSQGVCGKNTPTELEFLKSLWGLGTEEELGFRIVPPEPVFVDLSRRPGIDSQPGGPVRYLLSYWPARLHRLAKSIPRYRFLGSVNVYKYGLRLHRLADFIPWNQFRGPINI
jgi:hypothetical protein